MYTGAGGICYTIAMVEKQDASFGIVPARFANGEWQVLLIHQISNMRGDSYWILPKGHAEGSETPLEAAERELYEETGLRAERIDTAETFTLRYNFRYEGEQINKTVTYYIGYVPETAQLTLRPEEVKEAVWCNEAEARSRITHQNARHMLTDVFRHLSA